MCTVTFLPLKHDKFILTSNRDETPLRATNLPEVYIEDGIKMLYPKDKLAGGTWIGISNLNRLVCVLNGGSVKHHRKPTYRLSRGIIAKNILKSADLIKYVNNLDLTEIEPFTMVIVDYSVAVPKLYELVWDDPQKRFQQLENRPKIWSSSTLYTEDSKETRKQWFQEFLNDNGISKQGIAEFHRSEKGDKSNAILMKRPQVETVSITSVEATASGIKLNYQDVIHNRNSHHLF